jgi:hypothetical protein
MTNYYRPSRFAPTGKPKQEWSIGSTVKVGFLTLTVAHKILTPSGEPDVYRLTGRNGAQYDFVPHGGLHRVA